MEEDRRRIYAVISKYHAKIPRIRRDQQGNDDPGDGSDHGDRPHVRY